MKLLPYYHIYILTIYLFTMYLQYIMLYIFIYITYDMKKDGSDDFYGCCYEIFNNTQCVFFYWENVRKFNLFSIFYFF